MKRILSRLFAIALVAVIGLTGCSGGTGADGLSGNYSQDTIAVIDSLRTAINLSNDDPTRPAIQSDAKGKINAFASRYRRNNSVSGLSSFATMRTALNALAGHYSAYPNRPVPEKLKKRLEQEFAQIEAALRRGA
ncbi:MAG: photosystem II protein Psb27 [Cyanobacteria bacterium P01_A01_bin.114]